MTVNDLRRELATLPGDLRICFRCHDWEEHDIIDIKSVSCALVKRFPGHFTDATAEIIIEKNVNPDSFGTETLRLCRKSEVADLVAVIGV